MNAHGHVEIRFDELQMTAVICRAYADPTFSIVECYDEGGSEMLRLTPRDVGKIYGEELRQDLEVMLPQFPLYTTN